MLAWDMADTEACGLSGRSRAAGTCKDAATHRRNDSVCKFMN
jgi:hypothetical protein